MTTILEIDTKKSLFEPIEIKIDGETYMVKELTAGILKRIQVLAQDVKQGSVSAIQEQIGLLLDLPADVFDKLSLKNLESLVTTLVENSLNPPKGQEKNG